jgi:PTH1 family peptidyl-tRNA hydrolase
MLTSNVCNVASQSKLQVTGKKLQAEIQKNPDTFNLKLFTFYCYNLAMAWIIVGLGNPGGQYESTRHNAGRLALQYFSKFEQFSEWKENKKVQATIASGAIEKNLVTLVLPDTFMNKSGLAVAKFVKSAKAAARLIVVYDDLDLPFGQMKVSFNRGSGGHKGVESIMRVVKTKKFTRVRIGISPTTAGGALRKPEGEKDVEKHILSNFKPTETEELRKLFKNVTHALEKIVIEGRERAMNEFN